MGQGDAILIKCPSKQNVLIDTGNLSEAYKLKSFLAKTRVTKINALVITHMHLDHVGGLFCLLPELNLRKIYDNGAILSGNDFWEEYINLVRELSVKREILREGDKLCVGNLVLQILAPSEPLGTDLNADSVVMKIQYDKIAFLMTGDLNIKGEERLIDKGINLQSQVLKVGHHGVADATSEILLERVNPEIAVISVGKANRYEYPCAETISRLKIKG